MSLIKVMKGWREVLKIALLRKGPARLHIGKTNVVSKTAKERKLDVEVDGAHNKRFKSSLLRSIFLRHSGLVGKDSLAHLRPRYAGVNRMRNAPVLSLVGLSLGLGLDDMNLLSDSYKESTMSAVRNVFKDYRWEPCQLESKPQSLDDLDINVTSVIGNGCEGAVFEAKLKSKGASAMSEVEMEGQGYDLAVKAVFNYGAESNASSILRELKRETVPLQPSRSDCEPNLEEEIINRNMFRLPTHPNIVDMHGVFVDDMLVTEQGRREFPAAMPRRLNPEGCFGRNKTLYLVMRKCTTRLSDYLSSHIPMKTRCLLLMQLLEAVHHMNSNGVAHRDIKADNILIDVPGKQGTPRLQVCDFGCCLAEENKKLVLPFVSSDVNLGGNSWLMAPEIACATPGEGSVLDFRKSDLWACGALAYQILGADNPFYPNDFKQLKSKTYREDELPSLPDNVPVPIKKLVKSLLARDPAKRPSSSTAVLVVKMTLWDSSSSSKKHSHSSDPSPSPTKNNSGNRKRHHHRVVVTKGNHKTSSYIRYVHEERQKMGLVLGEMFDLIRKMAAMKMADGFSAPPLKQDVVDISNFLCLSRLTQADFAMALKFFH